MRVCALLVKNTRLEGKCGCRNGPDRTLRRNNNNKLAVISTFNIGRDYLSEKNSKRQICKRKREVLRNWHVNNKCDRSSSYEKKPRNVNSRKIYSETEKGKKDGLKKTVISCFCKLPLISSPFIAVYSLAASRYDDLSQLNVRCHEGGIRSKRYRFHELPKSVWKIENTNFK